MCFVWFVPDVTPSTFDTPDGRAVSPSASHTKSRTAEDGSYNNLHSVLKIPHAKISNTIVIQSCSTKYYSYTISNIKITNTTVIQSYSTGMLYCNSFNTVI